MHNFIIINIVVYLTIFLFSKLFYYGVVIFYIYDYIIYLSSCHISGGECVKKCLFVLNRYDILNSCVRFDDAFPAEQDFIYRI